MLLRKYLALLTVAVMPALAARTAQAAPVVNTYQVVSRFTAAGSVGTVTQLYTLAFDPAVTSTAKAVLNYSTSTGDPSFNPAGGVLFTASASPSPFSGTTVAVGGAINGVDFPTAGTFDFRTLFFVLPGNGAVTGGGQLIPFNADTSYSNAGSTVFDTFNVTVTLVASSVPEAATWAMMVAGIGMAGGSLRTRRRRRHGPAALQRA